MRIERTTVLTKRKVPTLVFVPLNHGVVLGDKKTALHFAGWLARHVVKCWPDTADTLRQAIAIQEAIGAQKLTKKKKKR
jgi:uncharacterized membrane protein